MPKKRSNNGFYQFMLYFRQEQEKIGIKYPGMAEVATAADPSWRAAPPSVRSKFEAMAKKQNQKNNYVPKKYTSLGVPLDHLERAEQEKRLAEEFERKDIANLVKMRSFNESILTEVIYLMDVNYYCYDKKKYWIAEMTILALNIKDGIKSFYHEMINPGGKRGRLKPFGYVSDVKVSTEEFGLPIPDSDKPATDYLQVLANIKDYLNKEGGKVLPPLFTMPEKVAPIRNFIMQMCGKAREDENIFRVYNLHLLFFNLLKAIRTQENEGFPTETLALIQLENDYFRFTPRIGCKHHEEKDRVVFCTMSRVNRWAFTLLDSSCPIANITPVPGKHLPDDFDIESILTYKEKTDERRAPTVEVKGRETPSPSCNASFVSEKAFDTTGASTSSAALNTTVQERVHKPLRMPKKQFSTPELTEIDFPPLSVGVGRGRGQTRRM